MKTTIKKDYDCVQSVRKIRERISKDTEGKSPKEIIDLCTPAYVQLPSFYSYFDQYMHGVPEARGISRIPQKGVFDAIDFIDKIRQAADKSKIWVGDKVIVIGGGNTAIDAAIQAKKLGAKEVTMIYRRGSKQMSATIWEQELAKINNVYVKHWTSLVDILGAQQVEAVRLEATQEVNGKLKGTAVKWEMSADMVLMAIGQKLNNTVVNGLKTIRGKIVVNQNYQTSISKVFAGGDCIASGEDLTVQAVEDGKQAAISIDGYLTNV